MIWGISDFKFEISDSFELWQNSVAFQVERYATQSFKTRN